MVTGNPETWQTEKETTALELSSLFRKLQIFKLCHFINQLSINNRWFVFVHQKELRLILQYCYCQK